MVFVPIQNDYRFESHFRWKSSTIIHFNDGVVTVACILKSSRAFDLSFFFVTHMGDNFQQRMSLYHIPM